MERSHEARAIFRFMKLVRILSFALAFAAAPLGGTLIASDAHASVSIAVGFDALVGSADTVAVVTPLESTSVWEDGRIVTYTRVKAERTVAGGFATGSDGWVRTMGGVVGEVGQRVEGEAVFTPGKSSMLFLHKYRTFGAWEVTARAQGQYPVVADSAAKVRRIVRSPDVGMIVPPKKTAAEAAGVAQAVGSATSPAAVRLASDVLHERTLDDAAREVATTWRRLHPALAPAK
jgi:hypothetical protein